MKFGFSYVGAIYILLMMLPNLIWTKNQPRDYDRFAARENRALAACERSGEVLICVIVLIFADFNLHPWSGRSWWLIASLTLMALYEVYWIRYFHSDKTMNDFYRSLLGLPVPGATLPVLALFLLAIYCKSVPLAIAVLIFGVGHIGIHMTHKKELSA